MHYVAQTTDVQNEVCIIISWRFEWP